MDGSFQQGLVIFDCDGVLVDSEPIAMAVMLEVLAEAGCDVDLRLGYKSLLGRSLGSAVRWLKDTRDFDLTEPLMQRMRARLFDRFQRDLKPIPGIAQVIPRLSQRVCVASSSQPDRIRFSLTVTGLIDLFDTALFSASMVAHGKPEPDLFLHAARQMGVAPADCTVIEDSPAGIAAAQAAGMKVIGFVGGSHAEPAGLAEAVANCAPTAIIADMADLPACLRAIA